MPTEGCSCTKWKYPQNHLIRIIESASANKFLLVLASLILILDFYNTYNTELKKDITATSRMVTVYFAKIQAPKLLEKSFLSHDIMNENIEPFKFILFNAADSPTYQIFDTIFFSGSIRIIP